MVQYSIELAYVCCLLACFWPWSVLLWEIQSQPSKSKLLSAILSERGRCKASLKSSVSKLKGVTKNARNAHIQSFFLFQGLKMIALQIAIVNT